MTDGTGAARRARGGDRPDALAYWYLQEGTPLDADPPGLVPDPEPDPEPEARRMASGWWLLPAILLSVPIWAAIVRLVFGQG